MKHSGAKQSIQGGRRFLTGRTALVLLVGVWIVFLTGVFGRNGYAPGLIQAIGLRDLLSEKQRALAESERIAAALQAEKIRLKSDPAYLEREVRRILQVIGPKEILIDTDAPPR